MARERRIRLSCTLSLFFLLWLCGGTFNAMRWPGAKAEDDLPSLIRFKRSVTDPLGFLANWDVSNSSVCGWVGVQCWNDQENMVLRLDLSGAGLSGSLATIALHLSSCTGLQTLGLSGNKFTGTLPSIFCNQLGYLISLDLSHNLLEGSIPPTISNCIYLNQLLLQDNHLSGNIPWQLGKMPRLTELNLSSNALSGRIPSSLTNTSIPYKKMVFTNNPLLCGSPGLPLCPKAPFHMKWKVVKLLIIGGSALSAVLLLSAVYVAFVRPDKVPALLKQYFIFAVHDGQSSKLYWQPAETHLNLTWEEVRRATSFFSPANIIGSGGSSTVYKGRLVDGHEIAVKLLHTEELGMQLIQPKQLFSTELRFLGQLRHRNLVKVLGFCCESESMAIILEYMPAGSLDAVLRHKSANSNLAFGWKARLNILLGVAEGLAYLHDEYDGKLSVIHGDLKPGNVLLDENMVPHIADFGIATLVNSINSICTVSSASTGQVLPMPCWSLGYTAPECVQQGLVSRKGDVFSFGVIVLELITGESPSSSKLKEGESLVMWVSEALAKGDIDCIVAPMLINADDMTKWGENLSATLKMGCACASTTRAHRPDMADVVAFLRKFCEKLDDNSLA